MREGIVFVVNPTFNTVSIIPGMELRAPERTDTRSGSSGSPKLLPIIFSTLANAVSTCCFSSLGYLRLFS